MARLVGQAPGLPRRPTHLSRRAELPAGTAAAVIDWLRRPPKILASETRLSSSTRAWWAPHSNRLRSRSQRRRNSPFTWVGRAS